MKRGWLAAALLAAMIGLGGWHEASVGALTGEVGDLLARAEARAEAGDWREAGALTRAAEARWRDRGFYVHVTLRHEWADEVEQGFGEVGELIRQEDGADYAAANARLRGRLRTLGEAEALTWENLL